MNIWRCDITGNPVGTDTRRIGCPCRCQGCRAAAEIERLRDAKRRALAIADERAKEATALRAALKQTLRQWHMYADMIERTEGYDLAKEHSPEGDMYRAAYAIAHEQSATRRSLATTQCLSMGTGPHKRTAP